MVPSPLPKRIFEIRPVKWLLEKGTVVICAGGGGIPTMYDPDKHRWLTGIEAVIDKDLASELLAREVEADLLVIATDVDGVYLDWGKPEQRKLGWVTPEELRSYTVPGRLHGAQGRGCHPVCGENRQARGHRFAGGYREDRGRRSRHERGCGDAGRQEGLRQDLSFEKGSIKWNSLVYIPKLASCARSSCIAPVWKCGA